MKTTTKRRKERRPQERGQRTRRAILEAALRVIARRGLGAATFRDIADEAGTSLGVVTYHFPSRRALLAAAFAFHLDETDTRGRAFSESYGQAFRAGALSLEEATQAVVSMLRAMVQDERDSFLASQELTLELTRDPELAGGVRDSLASHRRIIEELVEQVGADDPELEAEILSAAFQGLALKWLSHPDDPEFEARLHRVVRRLMERFLRESS